MPIATRTAILLALAAAPLAAQRDDAGVPAPYSSTLTYGAGLIGIPVAWISHENGSIFASVSARTLGSGSLKPGFTNSVWDLTESVDVHLGGRFSVGMSMYNTETYTMAAFGQVLLVEQPRAGSRALPSIAIGVRGLGLTSWEDRYVTGDRRVSGQLTAADRATGRGRINGNPTPYAVATREFEFSSSSLSMTVGYGGGLFRQTGDLGELYNVRGTIVPGLFTGARLAVPSGNSGLIQFMLENDGFDWNVGASATFGHMTVGLYMLEVEESKGGVPSNNSVANWTKTALMLGYNASLPGIVEGSKQRADAVEVQLALRRLEQEIAQRRLVTARLVTELQNASAAADKAAVAERDRLRKALEAERAALKAAADRLEQLQQKKPPEGSR